jgi:hypothetical protein
MLLAAVLALALVIAVIAYKYTGDFTVLVEQTGTFAKEGVVEADIESREDDNSLAATRTAWVLGFITAFNQYRSKPDGDVSGGKDTEVLPLRRQRRHPYTLRRISMRDRGGRPFGQLATHRRHSFSAVLPAGIEEQRVKSVVEDVVVRCVAPRSPRI